VSTLAHEGKEAEGKSELFGAGVQSDSATQQRSNR
jgi:hypothetical protein